MLRRWNVIRLQAKYLLLAGVWPLCARCALHCMLDQNKPTPCRSITTKCEARNTYFTHILTTLLFIALPSLWKALSESSYLADAAKVLSDADTQIHRLASLPKKEKNKRSLQYFACTATTLRFFSWAWTGQIEHLCDRTADWERGSALSASALFSDFFLSACRRLNKKA